MFTSHARRRMSWKLATGEAQNHQAKPWVEAYVMQCQYTLPLGLACLMLGNRKKTSQMVAWW